MSTTRPIVIIESPYAGDVELHLAYARAAMRDCLLRGEAPFASHALYTQPGVLDDGKPDEREHGITAEFTFRHVAARTVVYGDLGVSHGMGLGIAHAESIGNPVEYRSLVGWGPVSGWRAAGLKVAVSNTGLPILDRSQCLASDECENACANRCFVDSRYPGVNG